MGWKRRGLLIEPPTHLPWVSSHAAIPFVDSEGPGDGWIYFTTRDERSRSHIARARLAVDGEMLRAEVDEQPVLTPGRLGTFDDSGAMNSSLVRDGDRQLLYYQGWTLGITVPFWVFVGCAVSEDGGASFERVAEAPIMGRSEVDPAMVASPWVMRDEGRWRMWYGSVLGWSEPGEDQRYTLKVRYAESDDGLAWRARPEPVIDFVDEDEYVLTRPCVVKEGGGYRMWLSRRGERYSIGYAESADGITWRRDDVSAGLAPAASGWDSQMVEYGVVFEAGGSRFMLYNGNGFGKSGIGYAVWAG